MSLVSIDVTADELERGRLSPERRELAKQAILDDGVVLINGAIDLQHIDDLRTRMEEDLPELLRRQEHAPSWTTGHVQHQPPPFADAIYPDIVANPIAGDVARSILGDDIRIVLYTANTSLPGSARQRTHPDLPQLWPQLGASSPPFLLVANVTLVETTLDDAIEVWPRTHYDPMNRVVDGAWEFQVPLDRLEEQRSNVPPLQVPHPKGSLILRDVRMWHGAVPNRTDRTRVMMSTSFAPAWYSATPIRFAADAKEVVASLAVPVVAEFVDEEFDYLDPAFSGLHGPQYTRPRAIRAS